MPTSGLGCALPCRRTLAITRPFSSSHPADQIEQGMNRRAVSLLVAPLGADAQQAGNVFRIGLLLIGASRWRNYRAPGVKVQRSSTRDASAHLMCDGGAPDIKRFEVLNWQFIWNVDQHRLIPQHHAHSARATCIDPANVRTNTTRDRRQRRPIVATSHGEREGASSCVCRARSVTGPVKEAEWYRHNPQQIHRPQSKHTKT